MANPQTENGFTSIANEIAEKFCSYRISGEEWMVLWAILRKTYGWNKKEDRIALSQFAVMTGLKRQTVLRAISKLSSKKIIAVIKNDDSQINTYRFNKDFDQWAALSKKIMVSSKKIITVTKKDNQLSSKKGHTKDNITKDTIQKKIIVPDWIPEKSWIDFVEHRKSLKGKTFTPRAQELIIEKLNILRQQGHDPVRVINQSIENSWAGVFKLKGDFNGNGNNRRSYKQDKPGYDPRAAEVDELAAQANAIFRGQKAPSPTGDT